MFNETIADQVGSFGRKVILEFSPVENIAKIGDLIEPVPNIGIVQVPEFPAVEHGLMVELKQFLDVVAFLHLGCPNCPDDLRQPRWFGVGRCLRGGIGLARECCYREYNKCVEDYRDRSYFHYSEI